MTEKTTPRLENIEQAVRLAEAYGYPTEDVIFIDLNRCGIKTDEIPFERVRFYLDLSDDKRFNLAGSTGIRNFFFGLPTHSGDTAYVMGDGRLMLGNDFIGNVREPENDTCDSTYPRRLGTVLNLNSQPKSSCHGCGFCHTFKQTPRDRERFKDQEGNIRPLIERWLKKYQKKDLSYLHRIDVVTGCFGNEERALEQLRNVRRIAGEYGYTGELFYFGSEITSEDALRRLEELKPFSMCLSLECFTKRDSMLKEHKSRITLEDAERIMGGAKERGIGIQFSYVLGIDPMNEVIGGMKRFLPFVNRLPVINVFQPHAPEQREILAPDAHKLEYFLDARASLEGIFVPTGYRPRTWGNYRCLWYLKFGNETMTGERLP